MTNNVPDTRVVARGDKLHIMTRRYFPDDVRRQFVGEVLTECDNLFEVQGYTFVYHPGSHQFRRKPELRTRVFSLQESGHVVNKIPRSVVIDALGYHIVENRLVVTDWAGFTLDINEFGPAD